MWPLKSLCMLRKKQDGRRHGGLCGQRLAVSDMNENDSNVHTAFLDFQADIIFKTWYRK